MHVRGRSRRRGRAAQPGQEVDLWPADRDPVRSRRQEEYDRDWNPLV